MILIADDNVINCRLFTWQLETLGYPCQTVLSGQAALQACEERDYDIVFMDLNLGDMDGYTVARTLRERERERHAGVPGRRTPIVAVTAHTGLREYERCMAAGMDDFCSKPVTLVALARLLVRWGVCGYERPGAAEGDTDDTGDGNGNTDNADAWLLESAIEWLQSLEQNTSHAGLVHEIAAAFSERAPAHMRRMRAAMQRNDLDKLALERFALRRHCLGLGGIPPWFVVGTEITSIDAK
jgi:CheY-like chemotaxis protein